MSRRKRRATRFERREARYQAARSGIQRPTDAGDDAVMRVMRVPPEQAGMRLDRFLQHQLRATSRTKSQMIVRNSAFRPDGTRLKNNHRMRAEERVILWRPAWDDVSPGLSIEEVFVDDDLVALNKPPLLAVHPTARHHRSTVTMLMQEQRPDEHLTLIHRLDRETSGLLLMARTRAADTAVKLQFEARKNVEKHYCAIIWGSPPWEGYRCELAIRPDENSSYRVRMAPCADGGQACATTFTVLERRQRNGRVYTMLDCELHTGRQHQIRVHLSAIGFPIVGDKLYGPDPTCFGRGADGELTDDDRDLLELERHALHAAWMAIDHPSTGARIRIEAPIFEDLLGFWESLKPAAPSES